MDKNFITEASEFTPRIKADLDRKILLIGGFFIFLLFLKVGLKIAVPQELFLLIPLLLFGAFFLIFFFRKFRLKRPEMIIKFYFSYHIFEAIFLTVIIYYLGGVTWIAPYFYVFYIVNGFWIYPRNLALLMLIWCNLLFASLVTLQYFRIVPGLYIFQAKEQSLQDYLYVFLTTTGALIVLGFVGFFSNAFYTLLNNKIKELQEARRELEKIKKILEIEVQARTRKTAIEKEKLGEEVRVKTKELEEERKILEEKVQELEKLLERAVSRELKMIELKEKVAEFKKQAPEL